MIVIAIGPPSTAESESDTRVHAFIHCILNFLIKHY